MVQRIFLGIPLNLDTNHPLFLFIKNQPLSSTIRWVPEDNLHITLVFLGDTDGYQIAKLIEKVDSVAIQSPAFQLDFSHFSISPRRNPYMVWAQFEQNQLFNNLCMQLTKVLKLPDPKHSLAHCTLARFKQGFDYSELKLEPHTDFRISVRKFLLYESKLNTNGAEYSQIKEFILN
jgi:RNA 2',3'-cyclic 3'-phosphodiesterase